MYSQCKLAYLQLEKQASMTFYMLLTTSDVFYRVISIISISTHLTTKQGFKLFLLVDFSVVNISQHFMACDITLLPKTVLTTAVKEVVNIFTI